MLNLVRQIRKRLGKFSEVKATGYVSAADQALAELYAEWPTVSLGKKVSGFSGHKGKVYEDGGYHPDPSTDPGFVLISQGIEYVCRHGIACRSRLGREATCAKCAKEVKRTNDIATVKRAQLSTLTPEMLGIPIPGTASEETKPETKLPLKQQEDR